MPNMSLGGSSGGGNRSTKKVGAAARLIKLRNIAKTHTDAGRTVPPATAKAIRDLQKEMGN